MKKISTLLLVLGAFVSASQAQGVYFKAGGGYGIPIASEQIGEKYLTRSIYDDTGTASEGNGSTSEVVLGSYGAGTVFTGAAGFMFNEFLGAELGVQYTMGKKFETSNTYNYKYGETTQLEQTTTQNFSSAVFINPSFVVTPGSGTKVPYGRFGLVAGSATIKGEESYSYKTSYYPDPSTGSRKWEYTKGMTMGLQAAVGMNWMITDKIDIFTEVNFISMTYYAKEYNLTEDIDNGTDNLPNTQAYYKKTIFKDKIDVSSEPDTNKPREALREGHAFSSLSLQVGITFLLKGHGEN